MNLRLSASWTNVNKYYPFGSLDRVVGLLVNLLNHLNYVTVKSRDMILKES